MSNKAWWWTCTAAVVVVTGVVMAGCETRLRPTVGCASSDECASLEICSSGSCVAQAIQPPDGGPGPEVPPDDSGQPDPEPSPPDAGGPEPEPQPDAGVDAGQDAGADTDAGDDDAGADAGQEPEPPLDAGQDAGVDTDAGVEPDTAVNLPPMGISRRIDGVITDRAEMFTRPNASCVSQTLQSDMHYATHVLRNATGAPATFTVSGNWLDGVDGFLFAYSTFEPTAPTSGCVAGDDDHNGTTGSFLDDSAVVSGGMLSLDADEEITLVVTSYGSTAPLGTYTLDVVHSGFAPLPARGSAIVSRGTMHTSDETADTSTETYTLGCGAIPDDVVHWDEMLLHNDHASQELMRISVFVDGGPVWLALMNETGTLCVQSGTGDNGEVLSTFLNADEKLRLRLLGRETDVPLGPWTIQVENPQ